MTVEILTHGVGCNLGCSYCYQVPMRDAGNEGADGYDLGKIIATAKKLGRQFTMFGGEALLTPIADLEKMFQFGLQLYNERKAKGEKIQEGVNGIQTNGVLITTAHVALFLRYQVGVGFSMDGPGDLNDARWAGSEEKTRVATKASQKNLELLLKKGVGTSLILTLHRGNVGTAERLSRVKEWLRDLDRKGLRYVRLHILEVDSPTVKHLELTDEENTDLFLDFALFETELDNMRFDVFGDLKKSLRGKLNELSCVWAPCDPLTTQAVQGIDGQGNLSNCGRTNKDGVMWLKADQSSRERQLALYHTPQKYGGCLGCRFFLQCNGQCPGTAIDGDPRLKSKNCATWFALLEHVEQDILRAGEVPASMAPERTTKEREYLMGLFKRGSGDHGDHWDHNDGAAHQDQGTKPSQTGSNHGDVEHGDEHGDHTDQALVQLKRRNRPKPERVVRTGK
jgi:uncharacterized protein